MENMIVSGALVVVIFLLFLVVCENSTFLRGFGSRLGTMIKWWKKDDDAGDEENAGMASVAAEENIVNDEPPHSDPLEAALERISRLEEGMAKVSEDTQGISEDMKDVVGALRISIDGLTSRLDQVDGAMEDAHLTIDPLPQNIQDVTVKTEEISKRLEGISDDLHRTLGFAIQKLFKCESCNSEGLVASQVLCSKCGKESWWGWWPMNESMAENEVSSQENPVEKIEG